PRPFSFPGELLIPGAGHGGTSAGFDQAYPKCPHTRGPRSRDSRRPEPNSSTGDRPMRPCQSLFWTTTTTLGTRNWTPRLWRCGACGGQADDLVATTAAPTSQVAAQLVARGLSVRDVAALLGISPQRVSQLTAKAG